MASLSKTSKKILYSISEITKEKASDFGWLIERLINIPYDPYGKSQAGMVPRKIYWSVNSLKRCGYLEKTQKGGRKIIKITNKGKLALVIEKIHQKQKRERWDKKWRLVIFDIPENNRRERNFLRSYLKGFGLKELQKSVWIFPYDIEKEFEEFLKLCNKKFEGDIRFATIEKISNEGGLKKYFKLI